MSRRDRYSDSSLRFLTLKGNREVPDLDDIEDIEDVVDEGEFEEDKHLPVID